MARFDKARWRGPVPNKTSGAMVRPILGLVLHIEQGTEAGTDSWFHHPGADASAHFGNPFTGPLDQWVDTDDKAWAEAAGNPRWVSVEHEGYADKGPGPTASQIENDAQLLAWLHKTERVPLQITESPSKGGLAWHGMGGKNWGDHPGCPGKRILAVRHQIVTRAKELCTVHNPYPAPKIPFDAHPNTPHHPDGIRWVQWALKRPTTGALSDGDRTALVAFKKAHNLPPDVVIRRQAFELLAAVHR